MKITETPGEGLSHNRQTNANDWPIPPRAIAPWWHTAILVLFLLTVSALSTIDSKSRGLAGNHLQRYLFGMAWEWVLAAIAWWGIRIRHVPVRQLLMARESKRQTWAQDFGVAMIFWFMAMIVLAAVAMVLRLMHLVTVQKAVLQFAPAGALEMLAWFALCITAGIVEEFVFRGYHLQQFASIGFAPRRSRLWMSVLASSVLFGASHGYEGLGGMIAITTYGALFCMLAIKRRSLRPGMMAHAWHDSLTGIALAVARHLHAI